MGFSAGFSRVDITPGMGVDIAGYYKIRKVEGVLDPLEVTCLALELDKTQALLMSCDNCGIKQDAIAILKEDICKATGLGPQNVLIGSTHTHTGPTVKQDDEDSKGLAYFAFLRTKMTEAAKAALADLKPAKAGWGVGKADSVAFGRRFRMKDGSIKTNPGIGNPDIAEGITEVDARVNVLRFDREGAETIVLVNFANHPDTIGGNLVSADWPGFLRRTVERAIPGTKCLFFNGAEGDVNHINVNGKGGYFNDVKNDFDDVIRGYGHARHMGNYMAGSVLQVYDKVNYFDPCCLKIAAKTIQVPSNMPDPSDMPEAKRINDLHLAGKDSELPYKGMMLTTMVAQAARMVRLEHGPEFFEMNMTALQLGNIALVTIPGEAFTGVGAELKKAEGWDLVLPLGLTNGYEGYFPMQECYDEGGYEACSSPFKAGVAEQIVEAGKNLLAEVREL